MPEQIAFYGRKGVGTTTVVANVSAALAEAGHKVVLIGCGDGGASGATLLCGKRPLTLYEALRLPGPPRPEEVAAVGFKGAVCIEAGIPDSDIPSFRDAVALVGKTAILDAFKPDFVLYDLSGKIEGMEALLDLEPVGRIFAVTTADKGALHAVNKLFRRVERRAEAGKIRVEGIVGNDLPAPYAEAVIDDFARKSAARVTAYIPRSLVVTRSEFFGETVIDAAPLAHQAYIYRKLAREIVIPRPPTGPPISLDEEELDDWFRDWGDRLYELDEGFVGGGAAI